MHGRPLARTCHVTWAWLLALAVGLWVPPPAARSDDAPAPQLCVLYPDVLPPYREVFQGILEGIKSSDPLHPLCHHAIRERDDPPDLKKLFEEQPPKVVVTLGRVATQAFERSGSTILQIIGALDISPATRPNASGISLAVDPERLFGRLLSLAPTVKRILVVYDPARDRWIMDRARKAAALLGIELHAEPASTLIESAPKYGDYIRTAQSGTDAIWLSSTSGLVNDPDLIAYLIEQAWARRIIVFSNTLDHAKAGVLFAPFPDPVALGRRLGTMALRTVEKRSQAPRIKPLTDFKIAVNARSARHLGIFGGHEDLSRFDLVLDPTGGIE